MAGGGGASGSLRWRWVLAGALATALLLSVFVRVVDPDLSRLDVSGVVAAATLMLVGVVIGRYSPGETIRETGVAGMVAFLIVMGYLEWGRDVDVWGLVWAAGPFYAAMLAMVAGWVGEMLQGTLEDAHDDHALDWPWVFVCVVCGFVLEAYILFLGGALFTFTAAHLLPIFFVTIFLTGWFVGLLSPGFTAIEPGVASLVMVGLSAALAALWLSEPLPVGALAWSAAGGLVLGVAGGWVGEISQSRRGGAALRRLVRGT